MKSRLDLAVVEKFPELTRSRAAALIMRGLVTVNGKVVTKAGNLVNDCDKIEVKLSKDRFVSRGGYKLEKLLRTVTLDVRGKVAIDSGISTGGFTDCLLQNGVKKVYGVDVGYGIVHEKVRSDSRVILFEKTNFRYFDAPIEKVDLITLDLSFISVVKVLQVVKKYLKNSGHLIVLIKPQFEARKEEISRGGLVRKKELRDEIIKRTISAICSHGFSFINGVNTADTDNLTSRNNKKNNEFVALFSPTS